MHTSNRHRTGRNWNSARIIFNLMRCIWARDDRFKLTSSGTCYYMSICSIRMVKWLILNSNAHFNSISILGLSAWNVPFPSSACSSTSYSPCNSTNMATHRAQPSLTHSHSSLTFSHLFRRGTQFFSHSTDGIRFYCDAIRVCFDVNHLFDFSDRFFFSLPSHC